MDRDARHRDDRHRDSRSKSPSHRARSRSRSPDRDHQRHTNSHTHSHRREHKHGYSHSHRHHRSRHVDRHHHSSRSHHHDRHHRHAPTTKATAANTPVTLPFQARELSSHDLPIYGPILAMYLDIQKGLWMEDLGEEEVKGRWKSFVRRWNSGELAQGWYDPSTLEKTRRSAQEHEQEQVHGDRSGAGAGKRRVSPYYGDGGSGYGARTQGQGQGEEDMDEDDEEEYGPSLPVPGTNKAGCGPSSGPTIPTIEDLELGKESAIEEAIAARQDAREQHHADLRSHKSEMRHLQDEVAPRAEPGTHERRMQKRQEAAAANRTFAESRRGGSPGEGAPDEELMGSGENDLAELKKAQEKEQRKKNEREIKREEILRARAAEREERVHRYRQKEEETIGWLKTLAKQRFG